MAIEPADQKRLSAAKHIYQFLNIPYIWGGAGVDGFDCSGLILEILQSLGTLSRNVDMTADHMYQLFKNKPSEALAGCLVFWFNASGKAIHVEMLINPFSVIGASGGGSKTTSLKKAIKHNAFVKMNPIGYRGSNYKIVNPFKIMGS